VPDDRLSAIEREIAKLCQSFAASLPERRDALIAGWSAFENSGWKGVGADQLYRAAHSLAGSAATFDFANLGRHARVLTDHLHALIDRANVTSDDRTKAQQMLGELLAELSKEIEARR